MYLPDFSNARVLVVGDVMLDRYWWGSVNRISPEAPVPVVSHEKTTLVAGGAANVAANVAGMGAVPYLIGIVGDDSEAGLVPDVLQNSGISGFRLFPIKGRKTTTKTRIIAHSQQIARLDQETVEELSSDDQAELLDAIKPLFKEIEIVVISDYAKGFLTDDLVRGLISHAVDHKKMVLVDPKGRDYSKYIGATILTPNKREAADACGFELDGLNRVEESGLRLMETLSLQAILITRSEEGMTLVEKGKPTEHLSATARRVYDVTGAGDTVIATMAVALGSGLSFLDSARIANQAAGLVVETVGTTPISKAALESENSHS